MLVLSGWALDEVLKNNHKERFKKILFAFICISIVAIIIGYITIKNQNSFENVASIVSYFKSLSILNAIFIESCIALPLLIAIWFFTKKEKLILTIITVDVLINFWICLPYGGIGLTRESEVNNSIQQNIVSINALPPNSPVDTVLRSFAKTIFIKEPSLFANNIAIDDGNAYPSLFISYADFIEREGFKSISSKRGISLKSSDTNGMRNLLISANSIDFNISVPKNDSIIILQNYSDNWSAFVDNNKVDICRSNDTFISIPVTTGEHNIRLKYFPHLAVIAFFCSLTGWITVVVVLILYRR